MLPLLLHLIGHVTAIGETSKVLGVFPEPASEPQFEYGLFGSPIVMAVVEHPLGTQH